jgi:hypothetical protein
MISVFTKRHRKAIFKDESSKVKFPKRINNRVWKKLERFNWEFASFNSLSILEETESTLLEEYGRDNFYINSEKTDLKGFIKNVL